MYQPKINNLPKITRNTTPPTTPPAIAPVFVEEGSRGGASEMGVAVVEPLYEVDV